MQFVRNLLLGCILIPLVSFAVNAQGSASSTTAVVPRLVNFSGKATNDQGKPVSGMVGMTFSIYSAQEGGAPLWLETQNVQPDARGNYTVQLGATTSEGLPLDLFTSGEARWLGVRINGGEEQPRVMLLSVPYALKAGDAQTVGGLPASAFVLAAPSGSGAPPPTEAGPSAGGGAGPNISGSGTQDYIPLWTDNNGDLGNSILYQSGTSAVGINTTTPGATLDVNGGVIARGALQLPPTGTATPSQGFNSQPVEMTSSVFNTTNGTAIPENFQWQAEPVNNDKSNATGSLNLLYSSGSNPLQETGLNIAPNGIVTFNPAQTFPNTVSGITAGTGINVTGSKSNPTVGINTTFANQFYAQLKAANTFTANQTVNGTMTATNFSGNGSGLTNVTAANSNELGGMGPSAFAQLGASSNAFAGVVSASSFTGSGSGLTNVTAVNSNELGGFAPSAFAQLAASSNTFTGSVGASSFTGSGSGLANVNAASLNGLPSTAFSQQATSNIYQSSPLGTALPQVLASVNNATTSSGFNSNSLDLAASSYNSSASAPQNETFRWQAEPAGNNSGSPSGTLNLLFGANGAPPTETGVQIASNGQMTFASGQTFPGTGTITGITTASGSGLSGGGTRGNLSLSLVNTCAANQALQWTGSAWACFSPTNGTITGVTAGTGLSGGGNSGAVTLTNTGLLGLTAGSGISVGSGQTPTVSVSGVPLLAANNNFTGADYFAGPVGIGTTNPYAALDIFGNVATNSVFSFSNVQQYSSPFDVYISAPASETLGFFTSNTQQMMITGSGAVAIDTNLPFGAFAQLEVDQAATGFDEAIYAVGANQYNGGLGYFAQAGGATGADGEGGNGIGALGGFGYYGGDGGYFEGGGGNVEYGDGIYGRAAGSGGYAGNFYGNVQILGNLSKSGGSFKIDHPLDPANKYLYHSFVESPDMKNIYDGVATLDGNGEAVIQMPEWFGVLNRDFRYQLTCIGGFAPVFIAEEIADNRFKIGGGRAGMRVSWQVTGIRQDAWANAHRIPVEEEKEARLKGFYLNPELFGAPPEKQIEWARHPHMMKKMLEYRQRMNDKQARPAQSTALTHGGTK